MKMLAFSSIILSCVGLASAGELIGPMVQWKETPATKATILWLEKDGANAPTGYSCLVQPRPESSRGIEPQSRAFGSTRHAVVSLELSGLAPETVYQITILEAGKEIRRVNFKTAPAEPGAGFRFVTGGDMYHKRNHLDAMNRRAGALAPSFALIGGDLAYANNKDDGRWIEWLDSWSKCAITPDGLSVPMTVVIGNHEVEGAGYRPTDAPPAEKADMYYSLFKAGGNTGYQTLDFGKSLSFILLDSGHTGTIASQTDWLRRALAERQAVPRLMVCYHRPAWGTGIKEDATHIQKLWCPLFEEAQVDVVFENDHHSYKRTYPITGGKRDDRKGIPYLGDGAWGVAVRAAPEKEKNKRPWIAHASARNHLFLVTLTNVGFLYQAIDADGNVFDSLERPIRRTLN